MQGRGKKGLAAVWSAGGRCSSRAPVWAGSAGASRQEERLVIQAPASLNTVSAKAVGPPLTYAPLLRPSQALHAQWQLAKLRSAPVGGRLGVLIPHLVVVAAAGHLVVAKVALSERMLHLWEGGMRIQQT